MSLIKVENLSKKFKVRKKAENTNILSDLFHREYEMKNAVDGISFEINKGEIVGYIGPNGAGKSTTIKMLTGILVPTSGLITVGGLIPYKDRKEYTKRIGVVFGQRTQLWWDIPVFESLDLMKYIYNIPDNIYKENMKLFTEILNIGEFFNTPVRQLSLGQRMRADLCASLLHNPDILYLDEPTIGLDVVVKKNVRDFIKEVNKQRNTTVILTTHDMADIEKLCSRVIVIDKGSLMYDGSLEQVKDKFGFIESMEIILEDDLQELNWLYENGISEIEKNDKSLVLKYDKNKINSSTILGYLMSKSPIKDFKVHETEIDEAIRKMYLNQ